MKRAFPVLTAVLLAAIFPADVSAQSLYLVRKTQVYLQTDASTVPPEIYPYYLSFSTPGADRVTGPGFSTAIPASSSKGSISLAFHSQAELDAAYPNGTYTFAGPPSYALTVSGDIYPAAVPQVTGGNGTWSNGMLVVDASQDAVFQFSNFTTYASGMGGHEQFQCSPQDSTSSNVTMDVASVPVGGFTVTSQPVTTYTIPKNTLKAGVVYHCILAFDALAALDSSSVPNGLLIGLYSHATEFYMIGKTVGTPVAITVNPLASVVAPAGSNVTIPATGTGLGSGVTTAFWYRNGVQLDFSIPGKYGIVNGSGLVISNMTAADAGSYYVIIAGQGGVAKSNEVTVSVGVITPPVITAQPVPVTVTSGTVAFNVAATGTNLAYQWYKSGTLMGGATSSRLLIQNVTGLNVGGYSCVVSNSAGSVTSTPAFLGVVSQDPSLTGRLINESVLTNVATGGSLTVGFTVGGGPLVASSATQPLLVRGVGPTLGQLGVPNTVPDPALKVIPLGSQTIVASNDNWGSSAAQVIAADNATGAFPLSNGSLDAALTSSFTPHGYSAVVSPNTAGGALLAEIYDNTPAGTYSLALPHLVNLSVIAPLSAGGSLSAGFVIGGTTSRTLLIRAMGPSLAAFGLAGLPDPKLSLVLQSSGALVASNQIWGGDQQLASIASSVGGFAFASASSFDSALLVTVSPGITYTATASSASGASGQVLVEVYEVP